MKNKRITEIVLIGCSLLFAMFYARTTKDFLVGFIDGLTIPTLLFLIFGLFGFLEKKGVFNLISYSFDSLQSAVFQRQNTGTINYQKYTQEKNERLANKKNPLLLVALVDLVIVLVLLAVYYIN